MPYFITESNPECNGWAVVDEGDGYYGCHTTKKSAIDQAVAISISTEEPFEGERAAVDSLVIGDYVSWNPLDPEILAEIVAVEGQMAVVRIYEEDDGIFTATDKLMIINVFKIERIERPEMVSEKFEEIEQPAEPNPTDQPIMQNNSYLARANALIARIKAKEESVSMNNKRALPDELAVGDYVAWVIQTNELEAYAGVVTELSGNEAKVSVWDDEDEIYFDTKLVAIVPVSELKKIEPLPTADTPATLGDVIDMTQQEDSMPEGRAKWLKAAYAIKAKIEGTDEARALGKNEVRTNHIEMRAEGDGRTFTGYASVFNQPSQPLPFIEYVKPGAFKRSLQSRNRMMLLWNHDTSNPLASTRNGSLQLTEDNIGLRVTATLPDTTLGRDVAELVRTGVIDSMSFGFSVKRDSWSKDGQTRYLEDVALYEVSLVSTPAYEGTAGTVSVRSGEAISADALADALLKIESGEELEPEQGALVADVISKLTKTPEVEEVEGDILALKQKKLALLMMGI